MISSALSLLVSFLTNRIGQMALVALAVWVWTYHNTSSYWRGIIAQEKVQIEAAYKAEIARQESAAREIAEAATVRAEEDAKISKDMKKVISDYEKKLKGEKHVHANNNCVIDDDFSRIVHELSPASGRKISAPSAARGVRKAR